MAIRVVGRSGVRGSRHHQRPVLRRPRPDRLTGAASPPPCAPASGATASSARTTETRSFSPAHPLSRMENLRVYSNDIGNTLGQGALDSAIVGCLSASPVSFTQTDPVALRVASAPVQTITP